MQIDTANSLQTCRVPISIPIYNVFLEVWFKLELSLTLNSLEHEINCRFSSILDFKLFFSLQFPAVKIRLQTFPRTQRRRRAKKNVGLGRSADNGGSKQCRRFLRILQKWRVCRYDGYRKETRCVRELSPTTCCQKATVCKRQTDPIDLLQIWVAF